MEFPVNATLAAGLWFVQEQLGSLREKLYTVSCYGLVTIKCLLTLQQDAVGTHVPHHDVHTELPSDITAPGSNSVIGLNLISKFVRGNIHTRQVAIHIIREANDVLMNIQRPFRDQERGFCHSKCRGRHKHGSKRELGS